MKNTIGNWILLLLSPIEMKGMKIDMLQRLSSVVLKKVMSINHSALTLELNFCQRSHDVSGIAGLALLVDAQFTFQALDFHLQVFVLMSLALEK